MRIAVTLSAQALPGLEPALAAAGATPVRVPLLRFAGPADWGPVDRALRQVDAYAAIVLTSPRAATALLRRLGPDPGPVERVWAVGATTAAPLRAAGIAVHTPAGGGALQLAEKLVGAGITGRVLYPCGDPHREELPARIAAAGIAVEEVVVYRTLLARWETVAARLREAEVIVVGSPRTARALVPMFPGHARPALVCLGRATADAACRAGWRPHRVARDPTVAGLTRTLAGHRSTD